VAWYGDRFILRAYSPQTLLGGGVVLNPFPPKHRRFDDGVLRGLEARDRGDFSQILLRDLAQGPLNMEHVRDNLHLSEEHLKTVVEQLRQKGHLSVLGRYLVGSKDLERIEGQILSRLEAFHKRYPLKSGMSKEELKGKIPYHPQLVEETLSALEEVEVLGDQVRQKGRHVRFSPEQERERERIEALFLERKFSPPTKNEVLAQFDSEVFYALAKLGVLVGLTEEIYLHHSALEEAKCLIKAELTRKGQMRLSEMREIWGTSRKFAVPLAEYLDRLGFTHRVGDMRMLSERP
jgi:selenocysteine-specific elongation factor